MKRGFLNKGKAFAADAPTSSLATPTPKDNAESTKTIQDITFTNYNPHATVHYPEGTCVLTSIPPNTTHASSALRNERAECIFRGGAVVKTVFSTPKFPLPMPTPNGTPYQILPTPNMGFGMFASRDIKKGDLILAERPLILIPKSPYPTVKMSDGRFRFYWDKFIQPGFDRLSPENQVAYRMLANSHTKDGSGSLEGVLRTNGFGIIFGEGDGVLNRYTAVYKELSRANHSCRPNALHKFAMPTFSVQLRAILDIKKGDEIFVSYLSLPETTPKRQASLAPYGFQCTCASCTLPSYDDLYSNIRNRVMHLFESFDKWVQDRSLPQDHLIKQALALVPLLETNGFYCMNIYEINFVTLMKCYTALGDLPNVMKYSNMVGMWHLIREGNAEMYEGMKNPGMHLLNPGWGIRA